MAVERDLAVEMSDGTRLLADRWYPVAGGPFPHPPPLVLVRTPYGRWRLRIIGRLLAERGYQALLQSCRGTFGSGGEWDPFHQEASDGVDTTKWIANQPWGSVPVLTYGSSYMGLTQWALAGQRPPALTAMSLNNTASCFRDAVVFPGNSFSYETG
ncbi:MAG: CocE/NonD family hydrolase, partial [Acidimicrobiales bacterium]